MDTTFSLIILLLYTGGESCVLFFGHNPVVFPDGFFGGHWPVLSAALYVGRAAELAAAAPVDSVVFFSCI